MRSDTPFHIASVTKLHIATVVFLLAEQGLVDLDVSISTLLPSHLATGLHVLRGVDYTEPITPRHLLGHLSGLPDALDERPKGDVSLFESALEEDRSWTLEEMVIHARDNLEPHFPPSDPHESKPKVRYSDTNFQLLMLIAEQVTGESIEDLYSRLLFEPLGLAHTWMPGGRPAEPAGEPAIIWIGDRPFPDRPLALRSFRDLYSTVDDLHRFGRALFSGDVFDRPETASMMWADFNRFGFPLGMAALRAPSWPIEYGLGVMRFELSRLLSSGMRIPGVVGHTGSTGSWLWHCPDVGLLLSGTVDQTSGAAIPFRLVPRALAGL
jgi:CubicO group peptidase (beta-lactamase class C family)